MSFLDLAAVCRAEGVSVIEEPGWRERSAGSNPWDPQGIIVHHTAGAASGDIPSLPILIAGRGSPGTKDHLSGPLCQIGLARSGRAHIISARRANHAGRGAGEVLDRIRQDLPPRGDAGHLGLADSIGGTGWWYGIEVEHPGDSTPYPDDQIAALVSICSAICRAKGWSANRVVHHREWTKRKSDMSYRGDIRALVTEALNGSTRPHDVPTIPTHPWEADMPAPTDVTDVLVCPGGGYWVLTADGGIRNREGAPFHQSVPALRPEHRQGSRYYVALLPRPDGQPGYRIVGSDEAVYDFPTDPALLA